MYYFPDSPAKFPAILDSFKTKVDCIRRLTIGVHGGGLEGRQDGVKDFYEKCVWMI